MNDTVVDLHHEIGLFRYGLIADLVHLPPGTKGLYRRLEEKAAREYTIPGTSRTRVAAETLRKVVEACGIKKRSPRTLCATATPPT